MDRKERVALQASTGNPASSFDVVLHADSQPAAGQYEDPACFKAYDDSCHSEDMLYVFDTEASTPEVRIP